MTPAELRSMADQWHQERKQLPQELIYEMKKAALNGSYYIKHWGYTASEVKQQLRNLGFKVYEGYELGEEYTHISWQG